MCVLAAVGCGDSHSSSTTSTTSTSATTPTSTPTATTGTTTTPKLIDALKPPKAAVLKPGGKVTVSKATLDTVGWQVSCVANGLRVNAESVRGQHTGAKRGNKKGAREIIEATSSGHPSIWVLNNDDGSLVISCR